MENTHKIKDFVTWLESENGQETFSQWVSYFKRYSSSPLSLETYDKIDDICFITYLTLFYGNLNDIEPLELYLPVDLFKCQARFRHLEYISKSYSRTFIALKSYDTYVAFYSIKTRTLIINGRYSSTTYQHVRKFSKMLRDRGYNIELEVNLELCNWYKD